MSANIAVTADGKKVFASLRESPWWGAGVGVFKEELTGAEMVKAAHLDYTVSKRPMHADLGGQPGVIDVTKLIGCGDYRAIVREDTGKVLGVMTQAYEVYQNHEIIDFFNGLSIDRKIIYETAGALGDGGTVWVLARIPDLSQAIGEDETNGYFLIKNGHDGSSCLTVMPTTVRVVCQNTMMLASTENAKARGKKGRDSVKVGYRIRHTRNMREIVTKVQSAYDKVIEDFQASKELNEFLASKQFDTAMRDRFFDFLINPKATEDDDDELSQRAISLRKGKFDALTKILESPTCNVNGTRGSAFSLFQAGVEWVDHERTTRCSDGDDCTAKRFESAMFGSGARLKRDALAEIIDMVA